MIFENVAFDHMFHVCLVIYIKGDKTIQLTYFWSPSIDSNDIKWFMCYILLSINNLNVSNYICGE